MSKERPILFSAPMVRAILDGRKTQTRRTIKLPNERGEWEVSITGGYGVTLADGTPVPEMPCIWNTKTGTSLICPYGWPVERLWVRESYMPDPDDDGTWAYTQYMGCKGSPLSDIPMQFRRPENCIYRATWDGGSELVGWKPSIHMPRWASRILLEITGIRVERLQDISEEDARDEGVCAINFGYGDCYALGFKKTWESINGQGSWDLNPWVWVVEFKRINKEAA